MIPSLGTNRKQRALLLARVSSGVDAQQPIPKAKGGRQSELRAGDFREGHQAERSPSMRPTAATKLLHAIFSQHNLLTSQPKLRASV